MRPVIYADIRCLQDPLYQTRGVGQHVTSLLRSRGESCCASRKLVGLVDDRLDPLPPHLAALVDEVSGSWNPALGPPGAVFVDFSPMTHDPGQTLRFTADAGIPSAAVVYDFIPFDWPGYLPAMVNRMDYVTKLVRLRALDLYLPISEYSAWRLTDVLGVSRGRITVTGAAVRESICRAVSALGAGLSPRAAALPYFLSVGGGDRRKNTEAAVLAVRHLNSVSPCFIPLQVVGNYDVAYKTDLLATAGHAEGAGFLKFLPDVDDETLVRLYAGAVATIVSSYIEGFSLPVVEAAVCGSPVIASICGAHMELIRQDHALFAPDDHEDLSRKLERLLEDPLRREALVREQASIAVRFHAGRVGERFWNAIRDAGPAPSRVHVARRRKPRLAFLSPYPPDRSGVARYTQLTLEAASRRFDIDLYTNAVRPLELPEGVADCGRIGLVPLLRGGYQGIVSVIGNSDFHTPIFEVFERYGGPCILHDSRLNLIYLHRLGFHGFLKFAAEILGRNVEPEEVRLWAEDRDLPSLFVEPVLKKARPLMVHSRQYQALLKERYDFDAEVTPFCPNMQFDDAELAAAPRTAARQRIGLPMGAFVISTFGFVHANKCPEACIVALEMLRAWRIPAELYFVGDAAGLRMQSELERVANLYGVAAHVHSYSEFLDAGTYRDFMLASDAAVQLRSFGFGQLSAALADCIAAALPGVATANLAQSCDAPGYVRTVPDRVSPLLLAENLAVHWENGGDRTPYLEERRRYLAAHNFDCYVQRLHEILGLA